MGRGRRRGKRRLAQNGGRLFAYRLAAKLGQPNVDRMLRGMTVRQFGEWRAYADLEPFDETRADLRSADVVRTLLNLFGRKKGERPIPLKDCVLQFGGDAAADKKTTPEQARAQVMRTMQILMAIHNAPRRPAPKRARKGSA